MMRWLVPVLLIVALLVGCNGMPRPIASDDNFVGRFTVNSGFPIPYFFQGTAVQWNQDYAVTVRHIPFLSNVVHECSSGCDLVFIEHPARGRGQIPVWRDAVQGEAVFAVGSSPLLMHLKGEGRAKGTRISLGLHDGGRYAVHDGPIVSGMSGGPVYGSDGAVLGITVGILSGDMPKFGDLRGSDRMSLYLPNDEILREWTLFSHKQLAAKLAEPY